MHLFHQPHEVLSRVAVVQEHRQPSARVGNRPARRCQTVLADPQARIVGHGVHVQKTSQSLLKLSHPFTSRGQLLEPIGPNRLRINGPKSKENLIGGGGSERKHKKNQSAPGELGMAHHKRKGTDTLGARCHF